MKIVLLLSFFLNSNFVFSQTNSKQFFYESNDTVNLFAFIGRKISITEFDPKKKGLKEKIEIDSITGDSIIRRSYTMDYAFNAKYIILKPVFNNLKADTVDFVVYDHYGRPGFENYETVLLYISKSKEGDFYFHQKYQYDELHKSSKGIWKGKKGESIQCLFLKRKTEVFKARGIFK